MDTINEKNTQDSLARTVSVLFHPLFMPLFGLIILLSAPTFLGYLPVNIKKILVSVVFVNNVCIPMAMFMFFRYRNVISSFTLDDQKERIIPLLTISILYCTTSFIIFRFQIPFFLKSYIFATSVLAIIVSMINFWWKISVHAVGAGALTAAILLLSFRMLTPLTVYLIAAILISGLILWARLRLNSHNPAQVWVGYLTGILGITLFILFI